MIAKTLDCADASSNSEEACKSLIAYLQDLNTFLEIPRFSCCRGVKREVFEEQVEKMALDAVASGSPANNPREPSASEIVKLYNEAW